MWIFVGAPVASPSNGHQWKRATVADNDHEMLKLRLDYAWKYFDSAARQRMLFFNYFLIAVGILANAFGFAMKEGLHPVAAFVCLFGLSASMGSIFFDIRMLAFVERAQSVLEVLERQAIFPDGFRAPAPAGQEGKQLGLARTEPDAKAEGRVSIRTGRKVTKVKWWIRGIESLAALGFILGVYYACAAPAKPIARPERNAAGKPAVSQPADRPKPITTSQAASAPATSTQAVPRSPSPRVRLGASGRCSLAGQPRRLAGPAPRRCLPPRAYPRGHSGPQPRR